LAASHLEIKRLKEAEQETESTFHSIKEEITKIIEENTTLRKELSNLKALMEEAKMVNE
jgi:regulator of replication initiation timing